MITPLGDLKSIWLMLLQSNGAHHIAQFQQLNVDKFLLTAREKLTNRAPGSLLR